MQTVIWQEVVSLKEQQSPKQIATATAQRPCRAILVSCHRISRARQGGFEPQLVAKHLTRWPGFDDKIISLYARGLSVGGDSGAPGTNAGTEISPSLTLAFTDAVGEDAKVWKAHPLDPLHPIPYLDCIHVKVRDAGAVRTKALDLAVGVNMNGHKEALGLWIEQTEGAKFWHRWSLN